MTEHARSEADKASGTAGCPAEDTVEFSRLFVDLLGEQTRYSLRIAAALWQAVAWEEVVRAQGEFLRASFGHPGRLNGESAARSDQGRSTPARTRRRLIRDIMRRHCPVVAHPHETAQAAATRMTEEVCCSILVCDGDRLCGIFTERDLMTRVVGKGLDPKRTRLAEVMTRDPDRIESTEPAREALRRMDEHVLHHLPVMEGGRVLGVVSLPDLPPEILAGLLPELEQWHALAERMR